MPGVGDVAAQGLSLGSGLTLASTAVGLLKGIGDFIGGNSEEEKANAELSRLKQPFYKIQNEYTQNRNIGANLATSGLPEETKNYYTTQSERGLGAGISAINQGGGSPGDVARVFDVYNNSINKVAAEDATQRIANIKSFFDVNKELAGQKTMKWALDEYQPYERKLKEITERKAAAKLNQSGGINTAGAAIGAAGTALSNNDLMSQLFANTGSGGNYVAPFNGGTIDATDAAGGRQQGAVIQPISLPPGVTG